MDERRNFRRQLLYGLVVGFGAFALSLCMWAALGGFRWQVMDLWVRLAPRPDAHDGPVLLAVVDESSLEYCESLGHTWPWRRDLWAQAVDYMTGCGARTIVFDIEFPHRHPADDPMAPLEEQFDPVLFDAMAKSGRVCCAVRLLDAPARNTDLARAQRLIARQSIEVVGPQGPLPVYGGVVLSFSVKREDGRRTGVEDVAWRLGNVSSSPDRDGTFRRIHPLVTFQADGAAGTLPALSLAAVTAVENVRKVTLAEDSLAAGAHRIPLDPGGQMMLRWYGAAGVDRTGRGITFNCVSMGEIFRRALLAAQRAGEAAAAPLADPDVKDKIVVIGSNVAGLYDLKTSPFSSVCPGMEIHATAITNILRDEYARTAPPALEWGVALVLALVTGLVVVGAYRPQYTIPVSAALMCVPALAAYASWSRAALMMDAIPAWAGVATAFVGGTCFNFVTEGRRRRRIKSMFQTYVAPAVVDQMIQNPQLFKLGGERKEMTVFFSDVRGFTSLSEQMEPTDVVNLLNCYLTPVTDTIMAHGGTLDKYIGDAVVAIYGAPLPMEDHAYKACLAALDMIELLDGKINPEIEQRGWQRIRIGCGINSGLICAGNMGSDKRKDYTVIGDGVNLASRLEGLNKFYGTTILISEETHRQLGGRLPSRLVDKVAVKGRKGAVLVYELAGRTQDEAKARAMKGYADALRACWEKRWDEALSMLAGVLRALPADGPAQVLRARVERFKIEPPPADWDGTFVMDAK